MCATKKNQLATSHIFTLYYNSPWNKIYSILEITLVLFRRKHTHTREKKIILSQPFNHIKGKTLCSHLCLKRVHRENSFFFLLLLLLKTVTKYRFEMKIYDKIATVI